MQKAIEAKELGFRYGDHVALDQMSLEVNVGEIFALLGPNGSGKTTLFKLLSTLAPLQGGELHAFGTSVRESPASVRSMLGIVFQSPSLDPKLTVLENMRCQAALYGLRGSRLQNRIDQLTHQLGITDRTDSLVEQLSGGLKRRVELAKGMLHEPRLLLMDEPSTGLDPSSRLDLWHAIVSLQQESGVTVLLTTHLLDEANKADRIAIMDAGRVVACGQPDELKEGLGAQILSIETKDPLEVENFLRERDVAVAQSAETIQVTGPEAADLVAPLSQHFGERITSITLGQPSLEDVFVAHTGHQFWTTESSHAKQSRQGV